MRFLLLFPVLLAGLRAEEKLVDLVNPFLGTAAITEVKEIGFDPSFRVWAGLTYPGATLPNAMVQLSPITQFGSGAGYEYEDRTIRAFAHTNKGHWDLCHLPMLPVTGEVDPKDFASGFSHEKEHAEPGFYQVFLDRYGIDVELTVTPRCGLHRYQFPQGADRKVLFDLGVSNEGISEWNLEQAGDQEITGFQNGRERVFFGARSSAKISSVERMQAGDREVVVVSFAGGEEPLELRVGVSFVSVENARENREREAGERAFAEVRAAASMTWESMLGRLRVKGGSDEQRRLFYSSVYRSVQWPGLRSDVNGEYRIHGEVRRHPERGHYATPALWDTYRNKLVLLGWLSPQVAGDVIQSLVERGERSGHMATYFHGDHAAAFVAGSYLRGIRNFDVQGAFQELWKNAMEESPHARPHLKEYREKGYISTPQINRPVVETKAKAGVTKTLEYAYDDYALALLAGELGETEKRDALMERSKNYRNLFDPSTGLMRGRWSNGEWVMPFDATQPYYEYQYREANAWNSSFFAPHDTAGLMGLYESPEAFEAQLDQLFEIPWNPQHIAMNINSFIGQYCHGNQPSHGFPYLYHFVGKPEKSQAVIDEAMERFYGMKGGNTLAGMDDAGEMSAWYVYNAIGIYTYSPADPEYVVTVPIFDEVRISLPGKQEVVVRRDGNSRKMTSIECGGEKLDGFQLPHARLFSSEEVVIRTEGS
ncbi:putative alpha-1,2-mannosidase [Haloferula luteola]|uniref:Putative alpha-1,2-mannosidase n=1 Tax=Haloferula luteola TaxID=595692 RepID=A0A840V7A4_9BACT|nr:GH92 family glycosyl hydrolase [Haloferula luteola]MBB5351464.1 putative alpha-1,2-mannosidase [Haloferula luteola]